MMGRNSARANRLMAKRLPLGGRIAITRFSRPGHSVGVVIAYITYNRYTTHRRINLRRVQFSAARGPRDTL